MADKGHDKANHDKNDQEEHQYALAAAIVGHSCVGVTELFTNPRRTETAKQQYKTFAKLQYRQKYRTMT